MPTKIVDVTLTTMQNAGSDNVSPKGAINAMAVRSIDDEQVFESENLYLRKPGQPVHPSGATHIPPGQSLTYNVTRRLTISRFEQETAEQLNQMLIFSRNLKEDIVLSGQLHPDRVYQGNFNRQVRFDEINGLKTVSCDYNVILNGDVAAKLIVTYTVKLVA
ncbi:hypothetical protein [Streptomyces cucumeris]|uniref:hypothetical protein n=1 Tax=Streptomyces cucumeris TaxID=2962890 RepID=UPI0020C88628|nr:hypothetical protein [Streptomyces sp. NEAU-Y11]MCP9213511.1 hypothetical protein [Streptomyces sp. NEAU-Y11]